MANIIVRKYEHFNRSFKNWDSPHGKWINSKKQYTEEMARGGYLPQEQADKIADEVQKSKHKPYDKLNAKTMNFIQSVKLTADSKGNIKQSDRLVEGLKGIGVNLDPMYDKLPDDFKEKKY